MEVSARAPFVDVRVVETFAELLFAVHTGGEAAVFYNRLCEATCRLGDMDRAIVFVYDEMLRRVRVVGSHNMDVSAFRDHEIDLERAPLALRALREDEVLEVTDHLTRVLPAEFEHLILRGTRLVCTPVSAAGHWPGVIISDRPVDRPVTESERHLLWSFGKLAALADSARTATREHENAKHLQERIDLAREIHDGVIQRLFGVSLALSGDSLGDEGRRRCATEVQEALAALRQALQRPLGASAPETSTTLVEEVQRLAAMSRTPAVVLADGSVTDVPPHLEAIAQSVFLEALRNAHKHADARVVRVKIEQADGAFVLEVLNDGVTNGHRPQSGMGLKLCAMEALQHEGVVEFGPVGKGYWRVRLLVPTEDGA